MTENKEIQAEQHSGPHIPKIQWESVYGPINNTVIATAVFFIFVLVFSLLAKSALKKKQSRLKMAVVSFVSYLDENISSSLQDKKFGRAYFPLIGGIFFIVLFGNLFGLFIDWLGSSISPNILTYLRPMNSDLNTTLVLSLITVFSFLFIAMKYVGVGHTVKWYLFNFTGDSIAEKCINVFVGWLHILSIPSTLASLSLRLFGNIFAGVILLGIITYLGMFMSEHFFEIGRVISIPFWFFEIFVAGIQALVFMGLMLSYFKQSKTHH